MLPNYQRPVPRKIGSGTIIIIINSPMAIESTTTTLYNTQAPITPPTQPTPPTHTQKPTRPKSAEPKRLKKREGKERHSTERNGPAVLRHRFPFRHA
jgi:hypothetical protein